MQQQSRAEQSMRGDGRMDRDNNIHIPNLIADGAGGSWVDALTGRISGIKIHHSSYP